MKQISMIAMIAALGLGSVAPAFAQGGPMGQGGAMGQGEMPVFAEIDANADGLVTFDELEAGFAARFAENDTNGDGALDTDELLAVIIARGQARMEMMAENGYGQGNGEHGNRNRGGNPEQMAERFADRAPIMAERMIERMDRDANGTLSVDEARPANLAEMFARVDSDDDGSISEWEWAQARDMMAQRGGRGDHERGGRGGHGGHGGHGN